MNTDAIRGSTAIVDLLEMFPAVRGRGVSAEPIRGSTTIVELLAMFPEGQAAELMGRLGWPCAHCGARDKEPLSLAAKRHGNPARATIECFRALQRGDLSNATVQAALKVNRHSADPMTAWRRSQVLSQRLSRHAE